jgi:hypothetical protein
MDDDTSPLIALYLSGLASSVIGIARPVRPTRPAGHQARLFGRRVESAGEACFGNGGRGAKIGPL